MNFLDDISLVDLADIFLPNPNSVPQSDTLPGSSGDDSTVGTQSNDSLYGGVGNDTLLGEEGNDSLYGEQGNDSLAGGTADDLLEGGEGSDALDGGQGDDTLLGGADNDTLLGGNGMDSLMGGAGNDSVLGGEGDDALYGEQGDDFLSSGTADDFLDGGVGDDTLDGGQGEDTMVGGAGNDTYYIDTQKDRIIENANAGNDTIIDRRSNLSSEIRTVNLQANIENYTLTGQGSFKLVGSSVNNILTAGAGNDSIEGGAGNDTLNGGAGNDTLQGGVGNDSLMGGTGDDTYYFADVGDTIAEREDEGNDTVIDSINRSANAPAINISMDNRIENYTVLGTGKVNLIGNDSNNALTGNASGNLLTGGNGHDTLNGGAGADTLIGGEGDDTYYLDSVQDSFTELENAGTDTVILGANYAAPHGVITLDSTHFENPTSTMFDHIENVTYSGNASIWLDGNAKENRLEGGRGADILDGGQGDDTLIGNAGNDTLAGGRGADQMRGGAGNDTYDVDNADDVLIELANEGLDSVQARIDYALSENIENLTVFGFSDDTRIGTGNGLANTLTGTAGTLILNGLGGNDTLKGGIGNDTLDGGEGIDSLIGGAGNDHYVIDNAKDVVVELAGGGVDEIVDTRVNNTATPVKVFMGSNIENYTLAGGGDGTFSVTGNALGNQITSAQGNDSLDGGAGDDLLSGGAGNDTLKGGLGHDTLIGGDGADAYLISDDTDTIIEVGEGAGDGIVDSRNRSTAGVAAEITLSGDLQAFENYALMGLGKVNLTGNAADNTLLGNASANQLTGGEGDDSLDGGQGSDTLLGGTGDDYLVGGAGVDSLVGGTGDDYYFVDSALDSITELAGEGEADWAVIQGGYTQVTLGAGMFSEIENLTYLGNSAFIGTGTDASNEINGGKGNDTLRGLDGNDRLGGLAGNDLIEGGAGQDLLEGDDGNDTLNGGSGADTLFGGWGNDTYVVDDLGDIVNEDAQMNQGSDTVISSIDHYTLGTFVENLTLTGSANLSGTGNAQANALTGNAGNNALSGEAGNDNLVGNAGDDTLDGGEGSDIMTGGLGNDTYVVDNKGDRVIETHAVGGGVDTVLAEMSYTLGNDVENLVLMDTFTLGANNNFNGTGNGLANSLEGNLGNNVLSGLDGNDVLSGKLGNDTLLGGNGNDTLTGGEGNDSLVGGSGNDVYQIARGEGQDRIQDNSGSDVLSFDAAEISVEQLWFSKVGNDLSVSVIGTTDSVTIAGWYSNSANHIEQITVGSHTLLDTQVQSLVTAMSATGVSAPGQGMTTLDTETYGAVLTAVSAAWH